MSTVTYSDQGAQHYIDEHFIPVQLNVKQEPAVMDRYNICWTPTLIVHDEEGREHRRSEGFFNPQMFCAEMALGRLKHKLNRGQFPDAKNMLEDVAKQTKGDREREPEMLFWSGVAFYRADHDTKQLLAKWNEVLDQFPDSDWAKRVEFIRKK